MVDMHPAIKLGDTAIQDHDANVDSDKPESQARKSNTVQDTEAASRVEDETQVRREAHLHEAMHAIGEGARDTDSETPERVPSSGLRAAGTDALKQWSEAHAPKMPKIVEMDSPARPLDSQAFAIKVDEHAAASAEDPAEKSRASQDLRSSLDRWHTSSIHSAMRDVGSGVSDLTQPEPIVQDASESLKASGEEVLEKWSKAHKPSKSRFMSKDESLSHGKEAVMKNMMMVEKQQNIIACRPLARRPPKRLLQAQSLSHGSQIMLQDLRKLRLP
jgi:hypothetical protein